MTHDTSPCPSAARRGDESQARLARISKIVKVLQDLHWRYTEGPSGRGRAALGITNSTGCSSVWGSTYPYNPSLTLPLTIADWAASEPRFGRHFKSVRKESWHAGMVPFHEYVELGEEEREGKVPFMYDVGSLRCLGLPEPSAPQGFETRYVGLDRGPCFSFGVSPCPALEG